MMKKLMMLMVAVAVAMPMMAATGYANGYTWTYRISGGTAEIEGISPSPAGAVTLPSTLGGKPVTIIGERAFCGCSGMTGATLPSSLKTINKAAFYGCSGLKSIAVPSSVRYLQAGVFWHCSSLKQTTLPAWCKWAVAYYDDTTQQYLFTSQTPSGGKWRMISLKEYAFRGCPENLEIVFKDVSGGGSDGGWSGGGSGGSSGGGSNGGVVADIWKTARTLQSALVDNYSGDVKGVIQVKVGKANKKGQVSVSGTITGLDGKKQSAKGSKVTVSGSSATTTLSVKDGTAATVTIDAYGVSGSWNGCRIVRATIGGEVWKTAYFNLVNAPDYGYGDDTMNVSGHVYSMLLWPYDELVEMRGRKWSCEKAGRRKWIAGNCYDGVCLMCECSWGWVVASSDTENYNGLKLSYNMNTGTFKGSFSLYMTEYRNGFDKGVKKTVNVSGVLVDGVGYGIATLRGFGSWPVFIE